MSAVVLSDAPEDLPDPALLRQSLLEDEPGRERVLVQTPVFHDRIALRRELRGPLRLPRGGEHLRQVDGDQHYLLIEIPRPELLPELREDALRLVILAEPVGDPSFKPVHAQMDQIVPELLIERPRLLQDYQGFLRIASIIQEAGEGVLSTEHKSRLSGPIKESHRLSNAIDSTFWSSIPNDLTHLEKNTPL